ncbi:hypothetical protein GEMRC1_002108 [Eukaryota sp. GEM-RC1]
MPSSKRARVISLTKTDKKGKQQKDLLITRIREILPTYKTVFGFRVTNMRNVLVKELRREWNDSVFIFGRNKVVQFALGTAPETEIAENIRHLAKLVEGSCGLLLTNRPLSEVTSFFDNYSVPEYARSGYVPDEEFTVPAGSLDQFSHTQEPFLRSLGLPTEMKNGIIHCRTPFLVASPGTPLTPEMANVLETIWCKISSV